MGTQQDEKVAALRVRVEELKAKLAEVKGQRDTAREQRALLQGHLEEQRNNIANGPPPLEKRVPTELVPADDEFLSWCRAFGPPVYFHDGLATWIRNLDALESPEFVSAYMRGMNSGHKMGRPKGSDLDIHIEWRAHMALWAASHAKGLEGDFVECGVNTGIMSIAICTYLDFNSLDKDFYLFDTYRGIPEEQMSADEKETRIPHNKLFYEECFEAVQRNFATWPRCHLVRGMIPDTLTEVNIEKVAYLHIDLNIAAPERAALEFFWDKVVSGGVILFDDYGSPLFREQYLSANEFAASKGVMIATLP
ncbi:MAG: TylF/MycF/NovP-related O-methyltransferase, partial [Roseimicrobium sp.]